MKELIFLLFMSTVVPSSIIAATLDESELTSAEISSRWKTFTSDRKCLEWKGSERFEIAKIDGLKDEYALGEPIVFYVSGKSDSISVEKESGFYVTASLGNPFDPKTMGARVEYVQAKRAWKIEFTSPDNAKQYYISTHIMSGSNGSESSAIFGSNAWVNTIRQITVR